MAAAPVPARKLELDPKYDDYDFPTTVSESRAGHPGFLTPMHEAQIHQLRMMLESEGFTGKLDTLTLLRFLRARKFDVPAAKKMLVDSEQWRNGMTILQVETGKQRLLSLDNKPVENPPEKPIKLEEAVRTWDKDGSFKRELSQHYKQFYHKTDKDGRPCYFEKLGGINFAKLQEANFTNDKMVLNLAVEYEKMVDPRLPACSRKADHLVETSCTVLDAAGVSIFNPGEITKYIQQTSSMSNNNYPERMGRMYVINLHWTQKYLWKIVRGFLDPVTAEKIHVCTASESKAELLKQIPAENLPAAFGGECNCDGGCELSDAGPWHDEQWARPAWWEKDPTDATIENKPTEVETGKDAAVEGEATAPEEASAAEETKVAA
ncbi:CRAL-TRIO domain-containing protein [Xylaria sp. FL1042]|nr:CRAL-TRIO domain-containing protein [Xylaria sp. FL1042]